MTQTQSFQIPFGLSRPQSLIMHHILKYAVVFTSIFSQNQRPLTCYTVTIQVTQCAAVSYEMRVFLASDLYTCLISPFHFADLKYQNTSQRSQFHLQRERSDTQTGYHTIIFISLPLSQHENQGANGRVKFDEMKPHNVLKKDLCQ